MKISNLLHSRKNNQPLYCYTNEEYKEYQDYIRQTFGTFTHVFQEIRSPDIRLDLLILPPTEEREYYTIITMGAGAYRMSIP
ncbi:MAG: hypothetical protein IJ875_05430, partial [Solobacterium sp.]|nr:hypothetical protein [Solobacterium sp.]